MMKQICRQMKLTTLLHLIACHQCLFASFLFWFLFSWKENYAYSYNILNWFKPPISTYTDIRLKWKQHYTVDALFNSSLYYDENIFILKRTQYNGDAMIKMKKKTSKTLQCVASNVGFKKNENTFISAMNMQSK